MAVSPLTGVKDSSDDCRAAGPSWPTVCGKLPLLWSVAISRSAINTHAGRRFLSTLLQPRQDIQIACLEEIAYEQGFISADEARVRGEMFKKSAYGQTILKAVDRT